MGESDRTLASQPTMSRLVGLLGMVQNLVHLKAGLLKVGMEHMLVQNGGRRRDEVVIDVDAMPVDAHGNQLSSKYHGHYKRTIFLPLIASCGESGDVLGAQLRPGTQREVTDCEDFIVPIAHAVRQHVADQVIVRMDAGFNSGALCTRLETENIGYVMRLRKNKTLEQMAAKYVKDRPLEDMTCIELTYGAKSWECTRRVVLVIKSRPGELYDRVYFLVTNLDAKMYPGQTLVPMYRQRGKAEMHQGEIKIACSASLSSSPRPKSHYRQRPIERRYEVDPDAKVGAENDVRLQVYMLAYQLLHISRCNLHSPPPPLDETPSSEQTPPAPCVKRIVVRASCKTSESGYFLKNLDFFGVWLSLTNLGWGTRWGMDPRFFFERVGICPQSLKARGWKPPNFVFSGHPKVQQKMEVSMSLTDKIRRCYITCQQELFPWLETQMGSLPKRYQTLVLVLEMVCVEDHLRGRVRGRYGGRPPAHRVTLARTFIAKMVLNIPTTSGLRERLLMDKVLRSICGWSSDQDVPSESTFSRAFKEFSQMQLPNRIHMALIKKGYEGELVGHISRDSTAIEARQKPVPKKKEAESAPKKRKRGRPKKGEERPKQERRRMEKQLTMEMDEMLEDLPKDCTVGCKRNAKGHTHKWTGFKLHMDTADGGIPISCVVTSASVHDSQVAIPLARITEQRVTHCYDLMDSAYDAKEVYAQSENSGRCARLTGKM